MTFFMHLSNSKLFNKYSYIILEADNKVKLFIKFYLLKEKILNVLDN